MKTPFFVLGLFQIMFNTQAWADHFTLKCGNFGNDVSARSFQLKVSDQKLTIKFDATGETTAAEQVGQTKILTKYSKFSKSVNNKDLGKLFNPKDFIAVPNNLQQSSIQVRYYISPNQNQYYTATCTLIRL